MKPTEHWAGEQGTAYTKRQTLPILNRIVMFNRALLMVKRPESAIEFGANTGENLEALHRMGVKDLAGVEVNADAAMELSLRYCVNVVIRAPMEDARFARTWELSFTRGVLIHIDPKNLPAAYDALYRASSRWILLAEYYNPKPVEIEYRGQMGLLWKRDFAGEMLDTYADLQLVDYGFIYHRDRDFPQDDINWFLMEKKYNQDEMLNKRGHL